MPGAAPGQPANVEVARRGPAPVGRVPETHYARSGDHNIAYSVSGAGPIDLVVVSGLVSQIEHVWEEPSLGRFLTKLGGFCRIVLFDPRGVGLSDALGAGGVSSLEERVADIAAVMDDVGIDQAAILGFSNGGPPAMAMAAEHPDQVFALILVATTARTPLPPAYPTACSLEEFAAMLGVWAQQWGTGAGLEDLAPSVAEDARMRKWWAKCQRLTGGPGTIVATRWRRSPSRRSLCMPRTTS
jgi:pimeloyl-ACP methyl ester carboxylesterase